MIESELYTYLSTYAGLIALVGTRIYPVQAPKSAVLPYLVFFKVSNVRNSSHQGYVSLQKVRMQISCYADRYYTKNALIGVKQVAEQVILAMEAWTGSFGIQTSLHENDQDLIDPDTNLYHIPIDFFVSYGDASGSGWVAPSYPLDSINKILTFTFQGTLSAGLISGRLHFKAGVTVEKIALHCQDAPSGATVTVDILKNSVLQSKVATLSDGANDQETNLAATAILSTDEFAVQILTVGSTEPGAGLEVRIFYK